MTTRACGDCQLCCRLVPVRELDKGAGQKCSHQRHAKGCAVYRQAGMPPSCHLWNCRWLVGTVPGVSRPDRSHYVIDIMPDFITAVDGSGTRETFEVVQIWIDPRYPEAHRDPALRSWLAELGERNILGLIRFDNRRAITLVPPVMTGGDWLEHDEGISTDETHTAREIADALGRFEIISS